MESGRAEKRFRHRCRSVTSCLQNAPKKASSLDRCTSTVKSGLKLGDRLTKFCLDPSEWKLHTPQSSSRQHLLSSIFLFGWCYQQVSGLAAMCNFTRFRKTPKKKCSVYRPAGTSLWTIWRQIEYRRYHAFKRMVSGIITSVSLDTALCDRNYLVQTSFHFVTFRRHSPLSVGK